MLWRTSYQRAGALRHLTFAAENRIAACAWLAEWEMAMNVVCGDLEELGPSRFRGRRS